MAFDPLNQTVTILLADGLTEVSVPLAYVDTLHISDLSSAINYATQFGACVILLLVMLVMTPRNRFARAPTILSIVSLSLNAVRVLLLASYYLSSFCSFYTTFSADTSPVAPADFRTSIAATVLSIPVTAMIEASLALQAWSMIKLWSPAYRWPAVALSVVLAVATVAIDIAGVSSQVDFILNHQSLDRAVLIHDVQLAVTTASIAWFCLIFNVRLVMHMWTNRSILPSVKGLSAMEVLVMTNGILMMIPVVFAGLEYGHLPNFQSASIVYSAVIVVLPLGTLVAQRVASPSSFVGPAATSSSTSNSCRKPFLRSWDEDEESDNKPRSTVTTQVESSSRKRDRAGDPIDVELERIDGGCDLEKGVRVHRKIDYEVHRVR